MHIVWHEAGFAGIDWAIADYIEDLGERVRIVAEALAPVDTGALATSIELEMEGKTAIISANTFYAIYQEEGAGPHSIDGNPWLWWPGQTHPVTHVDHPGNPAIHFLKNALYSAGGG